MNLKNQTGVSLIMLVITILVAILLTTIVMTTSSDIPDDANYAKFIQELKNVQVGIEDTKIKNSFRGTDEEDLTKGFIKVYLEDAPSNFVTFEDELYAPITGYVVDLETIDYLEAEYGIAYEDFESGDTLTFGDKECDVFVFDREWTVYYVKGLKYDGMMNYTSK